MHFAQQQQVEQQQLEQRQQGLQRFLQLLPHCRHLNMKLDHLRPDQSLVLRLDPCVDLVGHPTQGWIHGGVLTVLIDTACSAAAMSALPIFEICATVDLRLDHYHTAVQQHPLFCRAWVTHITQHIVFTEGEIWQEEGYMLAKGMGTFMRLGVERTPAGLTQAFFDVERSA